MQQKELVFAISFALYGCVASTNVWASTDSSQAAWSSGEAAVSAAYDTRRSPSTASSRELGVPLELFRRITEEQCGATPAMDCDRGVRALTPEEVFLLLGASMDPNYYCTGGGCTDTIVVTATVPPRPPHWPPTETREPPRPPHHGNPGGGGDGGDDPCPASLRPGSGSLTGGSCTLPPECYVPLPAEDRVDHGTIIAHEGGILTEGDPPGNDPNSGVTIGGGVDLKWQSRTGLEGLGVSQQVLNLLDPYFGLGGQAATAKLAHLGLHLTQQQAENLTEIVIDHYVDLTRDRFNDMSAANSQDNPTMFYQLPGRVQTVIVDVLYLSGPFTGAPQFMGYVTSGDWEAAINELAYGFPETPGGRTGDRVANLTAAVEDGGLREDTGGVNCETP